jgi:predicted TIM-barrel fold metal-dependent hydrolase
LPEVAQFPLIDAHSHFLSDTLYRAAGYEGWVLERAKKYYSPEKLIEVMDRAGIPRMILLGWGVTEIPDMVRRYPARFIASYCGDLTFRHRPEYGDGTSPKVVEAVAAEFEAALRTGLYRGLGEVHTIALPTSIGGPGAERVSGSPIPPNAPLILRLIDLAARYQVPINIHCEATHLKEMVVAARSNPRATVIWAHTGSVLDPATIRDLLVQHPNLYFDLSTKSPVFGPRGRGYITYPLHGIGLTLVEEWRALFEVSPDRFLFGIDFFSPYHLDQAKEAMEYSRQILAQLTPSTARQIGFQNAERLYGLR